MCKLKKTDDTKHLLSWILISQLGKLKFSKSSYYYLVIVPIVVKLLEKVENPLTLVVGGSIVPLNLELPFSWYLFYFGAVSIAIGSILYEIFCPEMIKEYKNYGEFLQSGQSDEYLDRISKKYKISISFLMRLDSPYIEEKTTEQVKVESRRSYDEETYEEYEKVIDYKYNIKYQEERKNLYNKLYNQVKFKKIGIIYSSFVLYFKTVAR